MDKASKPFTIISGLNYYADQVVAEQFEGLSLDEKHKITKELTSLPKGIDPIEGSYVFDASPKRGIIVDYSDLKVDCTPMECRIAKVEILEEVQRFEKTKRIGCPTCPDCCDVVGLFLKIGSGVTKLIRAVFLPLLGVAWVIQHFENFVKELGNSLDKISVDRHSRYVQAQRL